MQAFSPDHKNMPPMPAPTAAQQDLNQRGLGFLTFTAEQPRRDYTAEYMKAVPASADLVAMRGAPALPNLGPQPSITNEQKFQLAHGYGNGYGSKGGFGVDYGDMYGGEQGVYNVKPFVTENAQGSQVQGAVIRKEGREMCTPGFEMVDGRCVDTAKRAACLPGWQKGADGKCKKSGASSKEFETGDTIDRGTITQGDAPSTDYPISRPEVVTDARLRAYTEAMSGRTAGCVMQ